MKPNFLHRLVALMLIPAMIAASSTAAMRDAQCVTRPGVYFATHGVFCSQALALPAGTSGRTPSETSTIGLDHVTTSLAASPATLREALVEIAAMAQVDPRAGMDNKDTSRAATPVPGFTLTGKTPKEQSEELTKMLFAGLPVRFETQKLLTPEAIEGDLWIEGRKAEEFKIRFVGDAVHGPRLILKDDVLRRRYGHTLLDALYGFAAQHGYRHAVVELTFPKSKKYYTDYFHERRIDFSKESVAIEDGDPVIGSELLIGDLTNFRPLNRLIAEKYRLLAHTGDVNVVAHPLQWIFNFRKAHHTLALKLATMRNALEDLRDLRKTKRPLKEKLNQVLQRYSEFWAQYDAWCSRVDKDERDGFQTIRLAAEGRQLQQSGLQLLVDIKKLVQENQELADSDTATADLPNAIQWAWIILSGEQVWGQDVDLLSWLKVMFRGLVEIASDSYLPPITVDKSSLYNLLINLIGNSSDAKAERIVIRLSSFNDGRGIHVEVSDDGDGMNNAQLEQAKSVLAGTYPERFSTKQEGGLLLRGLGLPTIRDAAQRLGAQVKVTSQSQKDVPLEKRQLATTFAFDLPVHPSAVLPPAEIAAPAEPNPAHRQTTEEQAAKRAA